MRIKPPFGFPVAGLCIALLLGAVTTGAASDRVIIALTSAYDDSTLDPALQSGVGGELPKNLLGDSIRMVIKVSSLSPVPDTLMAALSCSESKDSLSLFLVQDSAEAGTYFSQIIPIRRGRANADGKLDCLEPDMVKAIFRDPVYLDWKEIVVLIPSPSSVRGPTVTRAASVRVRDGFLRGGGLASRPPEGIACFDVRGGIIGWASPIGEGVWRLPAGTRPVALRMLYPEGSSRRQTVIPGR